MSRAGRREPETKGNVLPFASPQYKPSRFSGLLALVPMASDFSTLVSTLIANL
jgi:hypothetical protein